MKKQRDWRSIPGSRCWLTGSEGTWGHPNLGPGSVRLAKVAMTLFVNRTNLDFYDIKSATDNIILLVNVRDLILKIVQTGQEDDENKYFPTEASQRLHHCSLHYSPLNSQFMCTYQGWGLDTYPYNDQTQSKSSLKLCSLVLASDTWNTVPNIMLYIKNHGEGKKKTLHEYTFIYFSLLLWHNAGILNYISLHLWHRTFRRTFSARHPTVWGGGLRAGQASWIFVAILGDRQPRVEAEV